MLGLRTFGATTPHASLKRRFTDRWYFLEWWEGLGGGSGQGAPKLALIYNKISTLAEFDTKNLRVITGITDFVRNKGLKTIKVLLFYCNMLKYFDQLLTYLSH